MNFYRKVTRQRAALAVIDDNVEKLYPHNVLLYKVPPIQDITLAEFEELALERLQVLRILEEGTIKNPKQGQEWKDAIINDLNTAGLKGYVRLATSGASTKTEADFRARRNDYISHFILRLAYCVSNDLQSWFVRHEMELFRLKFSVLSSNEIRQFLACHNMSYTPITNNEKNEIKEGLRDSTYGFNAHQIEQTDFYRIEFTRVLDLVKSRRCFLSNGSAYVSASDFVSIIGNQQRELIVDGLQRTAVALPNVENDERVANLLKSLHKSYTGEDFAVCKTGTVPIESLDQLSKKSFPLCMRNSHDILRQAHHLKYEGRMQYGLFLKGIGVTLEDSLRFWQAEFTRLMDVDKFQRSHAYNIRHNYGKEGSMVNYTPYSCLKLITSLQTADQAAGCPFKMWSKTHLKSQLTSNGLSAVATQEVNMYAEKGHYQIACGKYFELTHSKTHDRAITHPNQYFEASQAIISGRPMSANKSAYTQSQTGAKRKFQSDSACLDYDNEIWAKMSEDIAATVASSTNPKSTDDWDELDMSELQDI